MKDVARWSSEPFPWLGGWKLVVVASAVLALSTGWIGWDRSFDVPSLRLIIRITARVSLIFFSLAFSAGGLRQLWLNGWTSWQVKNRRYLGLTFAFSHFVHALAIWKLAVDFPREFHLLHPGSNVLGALGYFFIFAMALTSFRSTAGWLGSGGWRVLHLTGSYLIWFIFLVSELSRVHQGPIHLFFGSIAAASLVVRILGHAHFHFAERRTIIA